jgi:hypothetical protein
MSLYLELTKEFNAGRLRAIICSGQAVVLHRLAIMSKDGDWILREDEECLNHVLGVLAGHGASYRFGAPLDLKWMAGGWSSHFEFQEGALRIRTDFFTRPPRIPADRLAELWTEQEDRGVPFLDPPDLADLKKTNRERDYAVIGELARLMSSVRHQLLYSRSARDLLQLSERYPEQTAALIEARPLLRSVCEGRHRLEEALDAERRQSIRANEHRLLAYQRASQPWADRWLPLSRQVASMPLLEAHRFLVEQARSVLPGQVGGEHNDATPG